MTKHEGVLSDSREITLESEQGHINVAFDHDAEMSNKKCEKIDPGTEESTRNDAELVPVSSKRCQLDGSATCSMEDGEDPWALPELQVDFTPFSELSACGKFNRVLWHYIGKFLLLLGLLYLFICSLGFLGDAFKLLGGKAAGEVFRDNTILANPVAGVMIGVLATVLLQSSSTTTSIVVSMVAEKILTVTVAIPIIMGSNIGTSVTNTIVSLGQITNKNDFRRAFAGATVHDMFNWLTVIVLLPLEMATGYLEHFSKVAVDSMDLNKEKGTDQDFLQKITKPFTSLIIQIDKNVIEKIALGKENSTGSIIKHCCDKTKYYVNQTRQVEINGTITAEWFQQKECKKKCEFLFEHISNSWSDTAIGAILLLLSLFILCCCLVGIVKILHSLLKGQMAVVIRKFVNANFPGKFFGYLTGYLAIVIGAGFTILVQSSSVFTSSLTPLVGMGVISLERMYPLTLGSNIGTTTTGILAALAQDSDKVANALQVAFCHLFFNISGIALFYPFPFFRPPIKLAKFLGIETAKYRWFALAYLVLMFFVLPGVCFALSSISWIALVAVMVPFAALCHIVFAVKLIQSKKPSLLPKKLRNWKFLPECLRSLAPYDRCFMLATGNCACCRKLRCCKGIYMEEEGMNDEGLSGTISTTKDSKI
ncbi:hypothetical protein CHS0354_032441 [Potamilus streckersoni]|uniref:Uncharacterized protein n=1 Tax=Potamilus streckersoni TaxID=2493646 RepID=A0AAE0VZ09_9BIVA|nr:hypothetical protein CHS0354_032441 [Potamilus streckersoni]